MKKFLIKIIKNNKSLYGIAKKINKIINPKMFFKKQRDDSTYICYILKDLNELENIKKQYELVKTDKTKLLVVIGNDKYNLQAYKIINNNSDINFIFNDYIKKYDKIYLRNTIFLNHKSDENLEIIKDFI